MQAIKTLSRFILLLSCLSLLTQFASCKKDILTDPNFELAFSVDTLTFDTVFVTLGSTTKFFTVINNENRPVVISSIELNGRSDSKFRINVDGVSLPDGKITDIEIPPKDSIYIFVEVTLDPSAEPLPFIIQDQITFITNENEQDVILTAFGQNAHFIIGEEIETQTWTDDLPYVVLNSMLIKQCHKLTIMEGVEVFFGGNSGMFVAGELEIIGSRDSVVTLRGVRLDEIDDDLLYDKIPGQWSGIFLLRSGTENCPVVSTIQHANIRNAQFGLSLGSTSLDQFSSAEISNGPNLMIANSRIQNHSVFGIYGLNSTIKAENLVVHQAGSQLLAFQMGGDYQFEHCTFYSRGSSFLEHQDELIFFSNYFVDQNNSLREERDLVNMDFTNCILYGSLMDEILPDTLNEPTAELNYKFDHCLLKSELDFGDNAIDCIFNMDPQFFMPEDPDEAIENDFHLGSESPCIDSGTSTSVFDDFDGEMRIDPDIGAYEYR